MRRIKTETLIIGGGPAGMACAMELFKHDKDFIVVEKDSVVGGLSKTYKFIESDGSVFYTDNGPHRFFSKNKYLYDFIENLIGEDWIKVNRQTRQYINGYFYDYPVNPIQALKNIGILKTIRIIIDYVYAKIVYSVFKKPIKNFEDYAISNFGKTLADFNIINYTEKIWGIPAREIDSDWALQRIKGLNVTSVIKNFLSKFFSKNDKNSPKSLVDEFFYPSKGTGLIYETIAEKIKNAGRLILLETSPIKINTKNNKIISVVLKNKEEEIEVLFNNLVESVPITEFIKLLSPSVPYKVNKAITNLKHRSQVYLFITLNKERISSDQWIYFPLQDNKISRISEMRNFSNTLSPIGKTSVFVEFFCFENDEIWNMSKDELFNIAIKELEEAGFISKNEVRNYYHIKKTNIYPVYDLTYKDNLNIVKKYLDGFSNLYYIGRPGRFMYNNQDHSLEMGILAAKSIVDGVKYDMDQVGSEKEYYEKGFVPNKQSPENN